jgi:hypothetical protein
VSLGVHGSGGCWAGLRRSSMAGIAPEPYGAVGRSRNCSLVETAWEFANPFFFSIPGIQSERGHSVMLRPGAGNLRTRMSPSPGPQQQPRPCERPRLCTDRGRGFSSAIRVLHCRKGIICRAGDGSSGKQTARRNYLTSLRFSAASLPRFTTMSNVTF